MVSRLKHENLVELLRYCVEGNLRVVAYEFATSFTRLSRVDSQNLGSKSNS